MAKLIFKLRNVPEDEADAVRKLLDENGIDYYETSAGNWGIAMPGIWLRDQRQQQEAGELIDEYQRDRARAARQDYEQQKALGQHKRVLDIFLEAPLKFVFYWAVILLVLWFSVKIFLNISQL